MGVIIGNIFREGKVTGRYGIYSGNGCDTIIITENIIARYPSGDINTNATTNVVKDSNKHMTI